MSLSHFKVGTLLPEWRVTAENDAIDSRNPIHDDSLARKLGFAGGLVPGVTVYGYLTHPLIAAFGAEFLEQGFMSARFRRPIYADQTVSVRTAVVANDEASVALELNVSNPAGEVCAVCTACFSGPSVPDKTLPPLAPLPESRRPATPESLRDNPVFGTFYADSEGGLAPAFLRGMSEDLPLYQHITHPAWLLRQANYLVDRNLALGPWIHVSSEVQHLATVSAGVKITVRGKVVSLEERNGNDYADIDVVLCTDRPVMRVLHRVIYRMGAA